MIKISLQQVKYHDGIGYRIDVPAENYTYCTFRYQNTRITYQYALYMVGIILQMFKNIHLVPVGG